MGVKWRFVSGVLAVVLVALLMAGVAEAQAAQTLHVAKWTEPQQVISSGVRPTVLYDPSDGLYKMWYKTSELASQISYATSTDGIHWSVVGDTNVDGGNDCPFVMKEGDTYYMFNYNGGDQDFYVYTSTDGINWTVGSKVFTNPDATRWVKIDNPKVINDGGTYKMYFQAKENATGNPYYILLVLC